MVPEMLACMLIVMWAQREYEEPAWHLYDEVFRDKVAATDNQKWSKIDTHIYNQIFTGQARGCCVPIVVLRHDTEECPTMRSQRKQRVEKTSFGWLEDIPKGRKGICWDFSNGACKYGDKCRFQHICSECAGHHPLVSCRRASASKKGFAGKAVGPH